MNSDVSDSEVQFYSQQLGQKELTPRLTSVKPLLGALPFTDTLWC